MVVADEIHTVTPSLFYWQAYEPAVKCDLSCCALASVDGLVFIDPVALAEPVLGGLASRFKPAAIVLTNGNHTRAAASYREQNEVPIFAHVDATDSLDAKPDVTLADGDSAPGGLRVVALPGAGPGEIALVGDGLACLGDAVINLPPDGLRLLPAKYCSDPRELSFSLRKLLSYDFDVMTFAHGTPLVGSARRHIELLLA